MKEGFFIFLAWLKTVNLFDAIKRFYGNLIDLIGFIVDKTSEQGADIAIRALPIVSPLPNAISMYYVSQDALGFNDWQAKAFAAAIELSLFGLFEIVLMMFDGYQGNSNRYHYPLIVAISVAVLIMFLIIGVVWRLETKSPVLAALPLFSAAGAVALALRRWHARNQQAVIAKSRTVQKQPANTVEFPILHDEQTSIAKMNAGKQRKIEQRRSMILNHLGDSEMSVLDLANLIGVSANTVRNDLEALQSAGHTMSINGVVKLH